MYHKSMRSEFILIVVTLFFSLLFLSSCLDDDDRTTSEFPSNINISFNIPDIGQSKFDGQNTLTVERARFAIRSFALKRDEQSNFNLGDGIAFIGFSTADTEDIDIGSRQIGGAVFTGVLFEITRPENSDQIQDFDFIVLNENGELERAFTMIIEGTFNGEPFEYKTEGVLEIELDFESFVNLPNTNGGMNIRLLPRTENWFRDNQSRLINPSNVTETEEMMINTNVRNSWDLEVEINENTEVL